MKILKIKVSGFKMLEDNFEINFLTKTRIDKTSDNSDLIELENGLFYPVETVFIGKNSSGKTTVIELIDMCYSFLKTGRIVYKDYYNEKLTLDIIYYINGLIYHYNGTFVSPKVIISMRERYYMIDSESLEKTTYKSFYKKDFSNIGFKKEDAFSISKDNDTSLIKKFTDKTDLQLSPVDSNEMNFLFIIDYIYKNYGEKILNALIKLFDDSIEYIIPKIDNEDKVYLVIKRINKEEINFSSNYFYNVLSSGTVRGIILFGSSILALMNGGNILVDEIEVHFNKNLIENLIMMFNDKTINKKGATLMYSSHYSEILDINKRCDNINILHRNASTISIKNMSTDYGVRIDLLKSEQFNQNTFDNLLNYDLLMNLKRELRK